MSDPSRLPARNDPQVVMAFLAAALGPAVLFGAYIALIGGIASGLFSFIVAYVNILTTGAAASAPFFVAKAIRHLDYSARNCVVAGIGTAIISGVYLLWPAQLPPIVAAAVIAILAVPGALSGFVFWQVMKQAKKPGPT